MRSPSEVKEGGRNGRFIMVVLFVILTFAVMVLIDHLITRKPIVVVEETPATPAEPRPLSPVIAGFKAPENLRYHPGHTWALAESPDLVRVGADDFAAKIAGGATKIETPRRGQWIRQGQKIFSFRRDGRDIELLSPIEGTVVDVNDAAIENPALTRDDPYGNGWLIEVNAPDAKTNLRNLLSGALVRRWMDDAAARLRALIAPTAGAFAQDGGLVTGDLLAGLTDAGYKTATKEFFLTA
jgi:glycine cleavage system H lipoate-binding protein